MDIDKIINDSTNKIFSDNEPLLEDIIDDLLDIMPEDERTFSDEEWVQQEQKVVDIVKRVSTLSVLSSILSIQQLNKNAEIEQLKKEKERLTNILNEKSDKDSHLTLLKNQNSSEQDETD